jgi:hypothetical protein
MKPLNEINLSKIDILTYNFSIDCFYQKVYIDLESQFKRKRNTWNIKTKSKYLESLILGIPTPKIILDETELKKSKYSIVDGRQRIITVDEFFKGTFKLTGLNILPQINGLQLEEDSSLENPIYHDYIQSLKDATICTHIIRGCKDKELLYELYLRLNAERQKEPEQIKLNKVKPSKTDRKTFKREHGF